MEEIKLFLHCFAAWKFQHVKRDANQVAHLLAKGVLLCNNVNVDLKEVLVCITSIVLSEQVNI